MKYLILSLLICFILINLVAMLLMFIDKRRAIMHKWRIPEKTLFLVAIFGGSLGILAGMYLFRHKTKHMSFAIGIPAILITELILILFITSQV